jgi:hypothetical protein
VPKKSKELHFRIGQPYAERLRELAGNNLSETQIAKQLLCMMLDNPGQVDTVKKHEALIERLDRLETYDRELLKLLQDLNFSLLKRIGELEIKVARGQLRLLAYQRVAALQLVEGEEDNFSVEDAAQEIVDAYGMSLKELRSLSKGNNLDALV